MSDEMRAKFQEAEAVGRVDSADLRSSRPTTDTKLDGVGPRARAMAKLREMIYCARPKLMTFWQRIDAAGQGVAPLSEWAKAMRACVVADDEFPWEWLQPIMLPMEPIEESGQLPETFHYVSFLTQYENALSKKLADQLHSSAVILMADNVTSKQEAEAAWNLIDRNGDGKLSYQELRPLLRSSALAINNASLEEDRVYSVLVKMDRDRTGFVDKAEFVRAVMRALQFQQSLNQGGSTPGSPVDLMSNEGGSSSSPLSPMHALGLQYGSQLEKRRKRAHDLRKELAQWTESDIANCWAATQAAIRALATTCGCASSVFQVLDGDGDGAIDRQEFQKGLMQLLRGSPLLKAFDRWEPLLWKLVDEDGSGFVSPQELNMAFSVRQFMSI
ncbi:unnamed protein product [Durusdinium trenchii]|uniref:EF-hand domain-containing protein n=2 Tax=Durusdinium trenchii TaxID=1381693 RepID=A0ABP0PE21_9DINO